MAEGYIMCFTDLGGGGTSCVVPTLVLWGLPLVLRGLPLVLWGLPLVLWGLPLVLWGLCMHI